VKIITALRSVKKVQDFFVFFNPFKICCIGNQKPSLTTGKSLRESLETLNCPLLANFSPIPRQCRKTTSKLRQPPLHVNSVDESLSKNDAHSLEGEATDKQPRKGLTAAKDPSPKGKTAGKTVQSCKPTGGEPLSKQALPKANEAGTKTAKQTAAVDPSKLFEEMDDIKNQLKQLTGSLSSIAPVITEIKAAYENYNNQAVDRKSDNGSEAAEFDPSSADDADVLEEPPKKKAKGDSSVLAVMAKMVNKPQQDGEDLTPELSELV